MQDARHSMFRLIKPKTRLRLETAHVQPEASETLTQHRANPASTSRSEGLRPDYTHQSLPFTHPTVRLLGIPDSSHSSSRACASGRTEASQLGYHDQIPKTPLATKPFSQIEGCCIARVYPGWCGPSTRTIHASNKRRPHTRGARARLAAPGRGATRGGVERAERKERKEEGHPFPPGEWGGIRGVSGVPSRKQCYQPGKGGPRPSGQG